MRTKVRIEIVAEFDVSDCDDVQEAMLNPEQTCRDHIDCVGLGRAISKGDINLTYFRVPDPYFEANWERVDD